MGYLTEAAYAALVVGVLTLLVSVFITVGSLVVAFAAILLALTSPAWGLVVAAAVYEDAKNDNL